MNVVNNSRCLNSVPAHNVAEVCTTLRGVIVVKNTSFLGVYKIFGIC